MNKKQGAYFVFTFAVLLIGRLCIAGTGYLEDQDEFLYLWIHEHASSFNHLSTWVQCLFYIQGQPPEMMINLFEHFTLGPIASAMHKSPLHPDVLYFIGLYNIIVSLGILYTFYRILLKINFSPILSMTGTLLLGTLFNSNLYTRHILPYDHALLFQLISMNLLLREDLSMRTILLAGAFSAIGLTNYLGCFMLVFINGGLLVFRYYPNYKSELKKVPLFILPFIFLFIFYELVARFYSKDCGNSYWDFLSQYSATVYTEGSPEEGLIYIFKYFYVVEKWWGILLLAVSFLGCYLVFKRGDSVRAKQLIFLAILAYISFGINVVLFRKMNFEGRVLHIYYPFVVAGVLGWIQQQKLLQVNKAAAAFALFACLNYCFVIMDFNHIGYPRNAIYKYHLFEERGKTKFNYFEDLPGAVRYSNRAHYHIDSMGLTTLPSGNYVLQNFCFLPTCNDTLLENYNPYRPGPFDSVIFEELHFESHPAYTMEYCTRPRRPFFIGKQFKIRVIQTKNP